MLVSASYSASLNFVKWGESIVVDKGCFASMVGDKEDSTSQIGLSDLAMD